MSKVRVAIDLAEFNRKQEMSLNAVILTLITCERCSVWRIFFSVSQHSRHVS